MCEAHCDCTGCNDREEELCSVAFQANYDVAVAHGCELEAQEFLSCAAEDNQCNDHAFLVDDSCGDELTDMSTCIEDSSDLSAGAVTPVW